MDETASIFFLLDSPTGNGRVFNIDFIISVIDIRKAIEPLYVGEFLERPDFVDILLEAWLEVVLLVETLSDCAFDRAGLVEVISSRQGSHISLVVLNLLCLIELVDCGQEVAGVEPSSSPSNSSLLRQPHITIREHP